MIIDLNVNHKTIQLLEENIEDLGYNNDFVDKTPKALFLKEIINKKMNNKI